MDDGDGVVHGDGRTPAFANDADPYITARVGRPLDDDARWWDIHLDQQAAHRWREILGKDLEHLDAQDWQFVADLLVAGVTQHTTRPAGSEVAGEDASRTGHFQRFSIDGSVTVAIYPGSDRPLNLELHLFPKRNTRTERRSAPDYRDDNDPPPSSPMRRSRWQLQLRTWP